MGRCPSGDRTGTINTTIGWELSRFEFVSVGNCPGGGCPMGIVLIPEIPG